MSSTSSSYTPPKTRSHTKKTCDGKCKNNTNTQKDLFSGTVPASQQQNPMEAADVQGLLDQATASFQQSVISAIEKSAPGDNSTITNIQFESFSGKEGQDIHKWLKKFDHKLKSRRYQTSPEAAVSELAFFLKGPAESFFNTLDETQTANLDNLKEALIKRFAAENYKIIWRQQLQARKQNPGESLEDFSEAISDLSQKLGLSDEERMYSFIKGLPLDSQEHVLNRSPKTFAEAEEIARLNFSIKKALHGSPTGSHTDTTSQASETKTLLKLFEKVIPDKKQETENPPLQNISAVDMPCRNEIREIIRSEIRAALSSNSSASSPTFQRNKILCLRKDHDGTRDVQSAIFAVV